MNTNKHRYRPLRYLIPLVIILAVLLSGCVDQSASSSSDSSSSSIFSSSSQKPEPNSDSVASLPTASSSSDSEKTSTPSYDMDSWDWQEHSYEGYTISLPSSCYIDGDKIMVSEKQIPQSLFKVNSYPTGIGWLLKNLKEEDFYLEKVDNTKYRITPWSDSGLQESVVSVLSDEPTMPSNTFYIFKDYIVFTHVGGSGGDGTREFLSKDTVYIPQNGQGMGIMFWSEVDSTECKPFYERVVDSIKPDTK